MIASLTKAQPKPPTAGGRADRESRASGGVDGGRSPRVSPGEAITTTWSDSASPARGAPSAILSFLVLRQYPVEEVVVATTLDAACGHRTGAGPDVDLQLLEKTQAYLRSLRAGGEPGPGARRAWEEFYRRHRPLVRRVVEACRLSAQDAEDCSQEVWAAILHGLNRLAYRAGEGRFCCWVLSVIRNRVIDFVRSERRERPSLFPDLERVTCCRELDPVRAYERDENRELVRRVLGRLQVQVSTVNYQIVHLRWIEGQTVSEVAARLELTPEQVRYRHYRVKKRLRALLQSQAEGEPQHTPRL